MGEKSALPARTPAKTPATVKNNSTSTGKQQSILGFFSKPALKASTNGTPSTPNPTTAIKENKSLKETTKSNSMSFSKRPSNITPVPSSDAPEPLSSQENRDMMADVKVVSDSLPSPVTPAEVVKKQQAEVKTKVMVGSSPSRKVSLDATRPHLPGTRADYSSFLQAKKAISYAEPSDDDDVVVSRKARLSRTKNRTRAAVVEDDDDEEEYQGGDVFDDVVEDEDGTLSDPTYQNYN